MNKRRTISKGYPKRVRKQPAHSVPTGTKVVVDPITYNEIFTKMLENQVKILDLIVDRMPISHPTQSTGEFEQWADKLAAVHGDTMDIIRRIRGQS